MSNISATFLLQSLKALKAFYSRSPMLLFDKDKPVKLKSVSFEEFVKGKELLSDITYEEVMLAKDVAEMKNNSNWKELKEVFINNKPVFGDNILSGINSDECKRNLSCAIVAFGEVLHYIIENKIFNNINSEKDFIKERLKLYKVFGIKK